MRAALLLACTVAAFAGDHWSPAEQEHFLATAEVIRQVTTDEGSTASLKATLSDGRRTHAAHVQHIDIYEKLWKGKDGSSERDFKDSWKFNVAAYRLARLLGLEKMVPVTVDRTIDGKPGSVTWWVDDVQMDEKKRYSEKINPPDDAAWRRQMDTIRVFDQLIHNMDRNRENLLITNDWKVWMIDHTRAFRTSPTLRNEAAITVCSRELLSALKKLKRADVEREISQYVTPEEINGLISRRDRIVELLEAHMSRL